MEKYVYKLFEMYALFFVHRLPFLTMNNVLQKANDSTNICQSDGTFT